MKSTLPLSLVLLVTLLAGCGRTTNTKHNSDPVQTVETPGGGEVISNRPPQPSGPVTTPQRDSTGSAAGGTSTSGAQTGQPAPGPRTP